jgi:YD repeat-containing protein
MGQVRWIRVGFILASLAVLASTFSSAGLTANHKPDRGNSLLVGTSQASPALVAEYHGVMAYSANPAANFRPSNSGGIREQVPKKYIARYQHWKQEFLTTVTGRQQWAFYQNNPNFTLTVVISRDNPEGGNTSNYEWNEDGKLVAATITLGCHLDEGIPNPVYFPVMNSLLQTETTRTISGETLAATKIAHEFGHVNHTAKTDPVVYQLQLKLMPQYNEILLTNGRDTSDPRLIELGQRMGATPVEIWEDREYWGETNAMLYLRDRFADNGFRCVLFNRIKRSIDLYARSYEERFLNIAESTPPPRCGW